MTKSHIRNIGLLILVGHLASCTSYEKRQLANGDFKYLNQTLKDEVSVPQGLKKPDYSDEFEIPDVGEYRSEPVGELLAISAPSLVLPIINGTHLDEGTKTAKISFDKINDDEPLDTTIWNTVIGFLEENGIGVSSFDKDKQELVTDWILNEESKKKGILGWVGLNTERLSEGSRFKFNFELRPHGRSGTLTTTLIDHLETVDDEVVEDNPLFNDRSAEVAVLNQVLLHYDYQARLSQARTLREVREGVEVDLGFDLDGNAAFVSTAPFEVVWARLVLAANAVGFTVSDLDQSSGLLYVKYGDQEGSWWSNLWGRNDKSLPLEDGDYRIKIIENEDVTSITFQDGEGNPLSADKINDVYPELSRVMASGRLGI